MHRKRVVVSVLNYNSWKNTITCLHSLLNQTYSNYKVLLIDNGSVDDSVSKITEYLKKNNVKYEALTATGGKTKLVHKGGENVDVFSIKSDDNLGFAGGHNLGARFAMDMLGADYVFILNNDVTLEKNTMETLVRCAEETGAAVVLPIVTELHDHVKRPWNALSKLKHLLSKTVRKIRGEKDIIENHRHRYENGAAVMVRKDVVKDIGLFDENFFLYYEDTDFFQRVRDKYSGCYIVHTAKVYHKGSQSSGGKLSPIVVYYTARNGVHFLKKHYRGISCTVKIMVNVFLVEQIKRYVHAILCGNPRILKYYYMGIRDAARGKYGRRRDLHVEYLGKTQKIRKE